MYVCIISPETSVLLMATKENGLKQNIAKHMLHELDTKLKRSINQCFKIYL